MQIWSTIFQKYTGQLSYQQKGCKRFYQESQRVHFLIKFSIPHKFQESIHWLPRKQHTQLWLGPDGYLLGLPSSCTTSPSQFVRMQICIWKADCKTSSPRSQNTCRKGYTYQFRAQESVSQQNTHTNAQTHTQHIHAHTCADTLHIGSSTTTLQ